MVGGSKRLGVTSQGPGMPSITRTSGSADALYPGSGVPQHELRYSTGKAANKLKPNPSASGPHSTLKRDPVTGKYLSV